MCRCMNSAVPTRTGLGCEKMWYLITREGYDLESCVNDLDTALMLAKTSSGDSLGIKYIVQEAKSKKTMAEYLDGEQVYACAEA